MKSYFRATYTEYLKIRKSKVFWLTFLAFSVIPLMGSMFVAIVRYPAITESNTLLKAKANLVAFSADWPAYMALLTQATSIGGVVILGFVVSWVFGHEYSDRTAKDLFALPVSRNSIVFSKFTAISIWSFLLVVVMLLEGTALGFAMRLPQWCLDEFSLILWRILVTAIMVIFVSLPVSFFASFGRGYMAPLGYVILTLAIGQIMGVLGIGEYSPWTIPGLYSGVAGEANSHISMFSYCILYGFSAIGMAATVLWWNYADQ